MLEVVIFSKDRACQLEFLLRTIKNRFDRWQEVDFHVVYTFSDQRFGEAYNAVIGMHPEFDFVYEGDHQGGFRGVTLDLIGKQPYVMFLVDDDAFKEAFSLQSPEFETFAHDPDIVCLSLRMCPRMDYCYTRDHASAIPPFERGTVWNWTLGEYDWHYPMSLDGNIFRSAEMVPLMRSLDFFNPNSLEARLAESPLPNPLAICFTESKVINLPVNRVQDTAPNRHGSEDAETLNSRFLGYQRISERTVAGVRNPSPHHELPLVWEPWPQRFLTVVMATEAIDHPELVVAYAEHFGQHDRARLVLFAPDGDAAALTTQLEPLTKLARLEESGAPDVTALAVPAENGVAALLDGAHALLTDLAAPASLADLPQFGSSAVAALREQASIFWSQPQPQPAAPVEPADAGAPLSAAPRPAPAAPSAGALDGYTLQTGNVRSSITDNDKYKAMCLIASRYDSFFNVFKQLPDYVSVLEHVSYAQGFGFIDVTADNATLDLTRLDELRQNDEQGTPTIESYPPPWGAVSPSTLRYIAVLSDLVKHFGSLDGMSIVEIGVGYGGQAKIIMDYFNVKDYTFLDLEEPLALTERYLSKYNYSGLQFTGLEQLAPGAYDLCISNYAFSELTRGTQDAYLQQVIVQSDRGYMRCNDIGADFGLDLRAEPELAELITGSVIGPEVPLTSPKNYLLTWDRTRNAT